MTAGGSAGGLSVTVKFEKVSSDEIKMTSTLTGSSVEVLVLFNDATRCGDH